MTTAENPQASVPATTWRPTKLDLALSAVLALSLPFVMGALLPVTGALAPMLLYYGLAWGMAKWRRGATGYFGRLPPRVTPWFWLSLLATAACLVSAYLARRVGHAPDPLGIAITALVWAPANASSEQLLWIYFFESWDLFPAKRRAATRIAGLALFTFFVGVVHAAYWGKFLDTVVPASPFGVAFILATTVAGFLHLVVWRKSGHQLFTFIPHLLLNLVPLAWTGYSILPYLFPR